MVDVAERRGPAVEPREIKQEGDAELRGTWAEDIGLNRYVSGGTDA